MTNAITTIEAKAQEERNYFTTDKRANGEAFVKAENAPSWLQTIIREAHGDRMPSDWVYEVIENVLDAIIENEGDEDNAREYSTEADIYNSDLLKWLSDSLYNAEYVNDAVREYGINSNDFDLYQAIQNGQSRAKDEIFSTVYNGLANLIED